MFKVIQSNGTYRTDVRRIKGLLIKKQPFFIDPLQVMPEGRVDKSGSK